MGTFKVYVPELGREVEAQVPDGWASPDELTQDFMPRRAFESALAKRVATITSKLMTAGSPGDPKNVYLTRRDAYDHQRWLEARRQAKTQGGEVIIIGDPRDPSSWGDDQ